MKKNTDITFILDRSGSMDCIKSATIEGFNSFLKDQKKDNNLTNISLVQFDNEYEVVFENIDAKEVKYLNNKTFRPRGGTALLDAIGKTISNTKARIKNTQKSQRPDNLMIVILTDGYENMSRIYSREKILKKIQKRENKDGWEFVFIGANQDAIAEAQSFGIAGKNALTFRGDAAGMKHAMASFSANLCNIKDEGIKNFAFSQEDRDLQEEEKIDDSNNYIDNLLKNTNK